MCISTLLVDESCKNTSGIAVEIEEHYEAFLLYSAHGGQDGITGAAQSAVAARTLKGRNPQAILASKAAVYPQAIYR